MIMNGICFIIFGIGTLYMIGHYPGVSPDPWYRVFQVYNVTLAFVGVVLVVSGVVARTYRGVRSRRDATRWR